jgi:MarR family transcriptional regulator, organic hydroperoxide resistance regulator
MVTKTKTEASPAAREAWSLVFELAMANRARLASALDHLGLTLPQAHALRVLDPERPLPMSEMAERLVCDASNITGMADRLEARGLVERRSSEGDRRIKVLALTREGGRVRDKVRELMRTPPPAIAGLSATDQRTLRDLLRRAVEHPS